MTTRTISSSDRTYVLFTAALTTATTIVLGALAAAIWWGVDHFAAAEREQQAEMRDFHANLIRSMESLAEKSGMLTSSDLVPVRFRLRFTGGWTIPYYDIKAVLTAPGDESFSTDRIAHNGTLEFGLVPPGTYRIRLLAAESYVLEQTFDVLPGVPVDRLVLCPRRTPPSLSMAVEFDWPELAATENYSAVCDIEPNDVVLGEWTWQPTERPCVRVVAGANLPATGDDDLGWLLEQAELDGIEVVTGAPYQYCRIRGITVYRRGTGPNGAPVPIARCVFTGDNEQRLSDRPSGGLDLPAGDLVDIVMCEGPIPTFEWSSAARETTWRIAMPEELMARIHQLDGNPHQANSAWHMLPRECCHDLSAGEALSRRSRTAGAGQ